MPVKYSHLAVEECQKLYLKYNGQNYALIEKEMRARWPKWSKSLLISVKATKTRAAKQGWPEKYGWTNLLKTRLQIELEQAGLTHAARLHRDIRDTRQSLQAEINKHGLNDPEMLKSLKDFSALELQALSRLELERGSYEGFIEYWEWLCSNIAEISTRAAKELIVVSDDVKERAKRFYGVGKPKDETE